MTIVEEKNGYSLVRQDGHLGILHGPKWIVRTDALFFNDEVTTIFERMASCIS